MSDPVEILAEHFAEAAGIDVPTQLHRERAADALLDITGRFEEDGTHWRLVRFSETYTGYPVPIYDPDGDEILSEEWTGDD